MLPHNDFEFKNGASAKRANEPHTADMSLYRVIIDASPTPMAVVTASGAHVVVNKSFSTLLAEVNIATGTTSDIHETISRIDQWPKAARAAAHTDIQAFWQTQDRTIDRTKQNRTKQNRTKICHWLVAGQHWSVTLTQLPIRPASENHSPTPEVATPEVATPEVAINDAVIPKAVATDATISPDDMNTNPTNAYTLISVTAVHRNTGAHREIGTKPQPAFYDVARRTDPREVWWLDGYGHVLDVHIPDTAVVPLLPADIGKGQPLSDYLPPKTMRILRGWLGHVQDSKQAHCFKLRGTSQQAQHVYEFYMVPLPAASVDERALENHTLDDHSAEHHVGNAVAGVNAAADVIVYVTDVSQTQQKMAALQASHDKLQAFYEATPDMVLRINRQGKFLDAHIPKHFTTLYDTPDDFRGSYMSELLEPEIANPVLQYLDVALRSGEVQTFAYSIFVAGKTRYRESWLAPLDDDEALWFVRDVSDQKRTEQQLEQSERLFRSFFEDSPTPYMIILYDKLTHHPNGAMVNQAFEDFLGYKQSDIDALSINYFLQVISHGEDYALEQRVADGLKRRNIMSYRLVKRNYRADGDTVWSDFSNITFNDNHGKPLRTFCVFQDITDRIAAEDQLRESREQLELALDAASLIVWNWHINDNRFVTRGWLPYNKDLDTPLLVDSMPALQQRIHPADRERFQSYVNACLAGKRFGFEVVFRLNCGANTHITEQTPWRWILGVGSGSDYDDHGHPGQVSGVLQDVHTRKLTELRLEETLAELEQALAEKNLLLAEVHHRVKNNMQVLGSLLSLQGREIKDATAKEAIRASQARVRAMAAVHEVMYHNDRFSDLNVKTYIEKVSFVMQRALSARDISLEFNLQDVNITIQEAIPCGLVFNELLSNALKHAFPDTLPADRLAAATVTVTLEATDIPPEPSTFADAAEGEVVHYTGTLAANTAQIGQSWVRLCVHDNGVGMPAGTQSNFGTFLVETLVDQLQGMLELRSRPQQSTQWCLSFPNQHPRPKHIPSGNPPLS